MADLVRSNTLNDGPRNTVMNFTNTSDGTGESAVKKVDVSTLSGLPDGYVCNRVDIERIHYAVSTKSGDGGVRVLWDGDVDKTAYFLPPGSDTLDFSNLGGLQNTATTGITGDINFTTAFGTGGHDHYSITLEMKKDYTPTAT